MKIRPFYTLALFLAMLGMGTVSSAQSSDAQATNVSTAKKHKKRARRRTARAASSAASTTQAGVIHTSASNLRASGRRRRGHHVVASPWTEPTYADSTVGDNVEGEDLVVRKAAVDALGPV